MQPISSSNANSTDPDSILSSASVSASATDVKVHESHIAIPTLNFSAGNSGEEAIMMSPRPWNTPRGNYIEKRVEFGLKELEQLKELGKQDWVLVNYSFTDLSAQALKNFLRSPMCHVRTLKFVNCVWDLNFSQQFCEGLRNNKSVTSLHIEGSVLSNKIGAYFRDALANGCYTLRTLNFINVTIPPDALDEIVQGIIAQNSHVERIIQEAMKDKAAKAIFFSRVCQTLGVNVDAISICMNDLIRNLIFESDNPQIDKITLFKRMIEEMVGVSNLCLEGCRLDSKHAPALKELIEESQRLRELNLQGNYLGSSKSSMKSKITVSSLLQRNMSHIASNSIVLIAEALKKNSKLLNLVLSSNFISASEWGVLKKLLIDTEGKRANNTTVTVNLTNNQLEKLPNNKRLIVQGSSPRSVSCQRGLEDSPRISVDTRPRRLSLRTVSDTNMDTEVDKVNRVRSETVI